MIGALLYYLHRHVRLVLIVAGLGLMFGVGVIGYEVVRGLAAASASKMHPPPGANRAGLSRQSIFSRMKIMPPSGSPP